MQLEKIVSGGQTGADRAGLDAALDLGIPCSGWCPKGRRAEDGVIPDRYTTLVETEDYNYSRRTEWNVRDSDATLVLNIGVLAGGTANTVTFAKRHDKPCKLVQLDESWELDEVRRWLNANGVRILNIAGPRESKYPGIQGEAYRFLMELLRP